MNIRIRIESIDKVLLECADGEITTTTIEEKMRENNPALYKCLHIVKMMDPIGAILSSLICTRIYRMFEVEGNLPVVSEEVTGPLLIEMQRNAEFFLKKGDELTRDNIWLSQTLLSFCMMMDRTTPVLKEKVWKTAVFFYSCITNQIEANNLRESLGSKI